MGSLVHDFVWFNNPLIQLLRSRVNQKWDSKQSKGNADQERYIPIDITELNPNDFEFNNLYSNWNGITHPCVYPGDWPSFLTYDGVFQCIFGYIDCLFEIFIAQEVFFFFMWQLMVLHQRVKIL